ncbi:MAG: ATP-binding protein [Nanoarchaeota archaeon]
MGLINTIKENEAKIQTSLSLVIKIILIISILYTFYFHLWRILFINLLLLFLIFIPTIIKKYNIEIPREIEFILLIFVVVSFLLGDLRGLVIQVFFGLAIGFIGFALILILYRNSKIKPNYLLIFLFALSFSLTLGTLSELSKYYLKYFLDYQIDIADYNYAITSLTLVLAGALIASVSSYIYVIGHKLTILKDFVQKFKTKNPNLFIERTDSPEEVLALIKKGENDRLEFKSTLRTNLHTNQFDRKIEHSTLKTISAFLNSGGGILLIGVSDNNSIFGIEKDNFQSNDKFNLHFTNLIKEYVGNEFLPYLHFELILVENKNILNVDCMKSDKPVFLKFNKEEEFYIRVGSATVQITGSKLVNYINNNFR